MLQRQRTGRAAWRGLSKTLNTGRTQRLAGPAATDEAKARECMWQLEHAPHWKDIALAWVEAQRNVCEGRGVDNRGHV